MEPFDSGSHALFTRTLTTSVPADWTVLTLPGRHWKWRVRGSAPYFALAHREELERPHDLLFASAYLPLAELLGLVPALRGLPSVYYFHENQLAYPVQQERERDLHFGFSQLTGALAADRCWFNSAWNRDSFLTAARDLMKRLPDAHPPGLVEAVEAKSEVMPLPLALSPAAVGEPPLDAAERARGPIILWNHRWEYDKDPETFFAALRELDRRGLAFRVIVAGQRFRKTPAVFEEARGWLGERVVHWGWAPDRAAYEAVLRKAHIAVSTAIHEFFGVAMLEAAHFGAYPLVPDRLAYPELFPPTHRYADHDELVARLTSLVEDHVAGRSTLRADRGALTAPFGAPLLARYRQRLRSVARTG